jgi:hypothetical protein
MRLTTSPGSGTDTLNCNWNCAYVNESPVAIEGLGVDKPRTTARGVALLYGGWGITLAEGFSVF